MPTTTTRDDGILVVGGGPTGLLVAHLLGHRHQPVTLVEQHATTSDQAKAISLDDESLRIVQRCGLLEDVLRIVLPGTGTRYFGARRQVLAHARGPRPPRHGHAIKSSFQQPELERVLLETMDREPTVEVRFSTALVEMTQDAEGVTAVLEDASGARETRRFAYVLGCDGGRSLVRRQIDVGIAGSSFQQPWLVLDTVNDPHDERYGLHVGDPARPHVIIPGLDGHCRYEFLLRPGEAEPGRPVPFDFIRSLLAPYRAIRPEEIERHTVYTFHALVAERWRVGRAFLLGDAAHMMPPFAGQGLNSGVRDADNLAWKLDAAQRGWAGSPLLDTYEAERRPHAAAMVRLSAMLGEVVMTTDPRRARLRDALVRAARVLPAGRRFLDEMRFRPPADYRAGLAVRVGDRWPEPVGRALPQPWVLRASGGRCLLDDALGGGFALLAVDPRTDLLGALRDPFWETIGARRAELMTGDRWARRGTAYPVLVDDSAHLKPLLRAYRRQVVLVRPDGYVAAVFDPSEEARVVAALRARMGAPAGPRLEPGADRRSPAARSLAPGLA